MTARSRWKTLTQVAVLAGSMVVLGSLQGCATAQNPDPIESWNRKVFSFNESLDDNVLKPVAKGYKAVTPEPVRDAFTNFIGNIKDVWSTINLFLQGRFKDGAQSVMRVAVNSTLGLAGLIDIATPMRLEKPNEDFGQTLGVWGAKPGAYIVWPLLGPSTVRDSFSIPGDFYFSAALVGKYPRERNILTGLQLINLRANLLDAGNLVDEVALDKYAFIRDAYLQRRQNLIYDGNPPDDDEPAADPDQGYAPASAAPSASAPASVPAPASSPTPASVPGVPDAPASAPASVPASASSPTVSVPAEAKTASIAPAAAVSIPGALTPVGTPFATDGVPVFTSYSGLIASSQCRLAAL